MLKLIKKLCFSLKGDFTKNYGFPKEKQRFFHVQRVQKTLQNLLKIHEKMVPEKCMKHVGKMVPKGGQHGTRNRYKIEKYLEKWMPKSIQENVTFQKLPKISKNYPRCDFEPNKGERVSRGGSVFGSQGPQRAAPSTRTRHKKEGERQKERRSKKERKGTR